MPVRGQGYIIARATQTTTLGTTRASRSSPAALRQSKAGGPTSDPSPCRGVPAIYLQPVGLISKPPQPRCLLLSLCVFAQVGIRKLAEAQGTILSTLTGVKGRGKSGLDTEQRSALEQAVEALEVRHGPTSAPLCFHF